MNDGAHALAEYTWHYTRGFLCVLRESITIDRNAIIKGAAPAHVHASARSEFSIAALVFAKHARTGLVRAIRGESGLSLAGMVKKSSGGRLSFSVSAKIVTN